MARTSQKEFVAFALSVLLSIACIGIGLGVGYWLVRGIALIVLVPGGLFLVAVGVVAAKFGFKAGRRAALAKQPPSSGH